MGATILNTAIFLSPGLDFEFNENQFYLPVNGNQDPSLKAESVVKSLHPSVDAHYWNALAVGEHTKTQSSQFYLDSSDCRNAVQKLLYPSTDVQLYPNLWPLVRPGGSGDAFGLGSIRLDFEKYPGTTWNILDKYWDKFRVVENSAFDLQTTIEIIRNEKVHRTSNQRVQAIKIALGLNKKIVRGLYYAILRELKSLLSAADYIKIRRDLGGHIASMQDLFSELTGKLKSVARRVNCVGYTIDKRSESRKKLKVILRQSDDEDSFLRYKVIEATFNCLEFKIMLK